VADVIERDPATPSLPPIVPSRQKGRRVLWMGALLLALAAGAFLLLPRRGVPPPPVVAPVPLAAAPRGPRGHAAHLLSNQGRYALSRSNEASLQLAIDYFGQAIARDPRFALAHARMAQAYVTLGIWGLRAPGDTFPRARDSVVNALRFEPRLAAAYASSGL